MGKRQTAQALWGSVPRALLPLNRLWKQRAHVSQGQSVLLQAAVTGPYLLESLEKEKECMPAAWPLSSKALATCRKSPFLPKHTSHTFTSGVKPQDATNLHE